MSEMPDITTLKIVWKGNVPGLAEHHLSIGAFGGPLSCILTALRRIASSQVNEAIGRRSSDVGRLPELARQIDVELSGIIEGSGGVESVITLQTPPGETLPLFNELPERSSVEFVDAVESESAGNLRNAYVRDYLRALHPGVTEHRYKLDRNGTNLRDVTISRLDISDDLPSLPYLFEVIGKVIGVGWEPGRNKVQIRSQDGYDTTGSATAEQVEFALEWRSELVRALFLQREQPKLLRLQLARDSRVRLDRETYIFRRWDGLLRRLAQ